MPNAFGIEVPVRFPEIWYDSGEYFGVKEARERLVSGRSRRVEQISPRTGLRMTLDDVPENIRRGG